MAASPAVAPAVAAAEAPAVKVRQLCVNRDGHCVLHEVDFQAEPGSVVGIMGPNGSGKTTFLRAILGLQECTGTVRLYGTDPDAAATRRRTAYIRQNVVHVDARFPMTVEEVVLGGRVGKRGLLSRPNDEDRRIARHALEETGMWNLRSRPIGRLSGGQKQRAFLARALAQEPDLLVLDEPTTGVDAEARADFYGLLRHLADGHRITILMVSHDPQALRVVADRILVLDQTVRFDGTIAQYDEWAAQAHIHERPHHLHEAECADPDPAGPGTIPRQDRGLRP